MRHPDFRSSKHGILLALQEVEGTKFGLEQTPNATKVQMGLARISLRCSSSAAGFLVRFFGPFKVAQNRVREYSTILLAPCSVKALQQAGHLSETGKFLWAQ